MELLMKNLIARFLCAMVLTGVLVADAAHFGLVGSEETSTTAKLIAFKRGTKTYDTTGGEKKWTGCTSGSPKNCTMISTPFGVDVAFSLEGIRID